MPALSVMFKTVSTDCNLDCSYCYYRESLEGTRVRRRIEQAMLERFIPQYLDYVADTGQASFAWQGGEPTLMGLAFFEWAVALQAQHARPHTAISNALQTNGTLLDDAWGAFLKRYNFLVGISLDGPEELHDRERKDRGGHGSFRRVLRSIEVVRRHGVDLNILCVVGPHNVGQPRELMRFFRREGFTHLQFIPAMDFQAMEPGKPPAYLITPAQYGAFLVALFDEWYGQGVPQIAIRTFDNFLQSYVGMPNDLCVHGDTCDAGIVVEYNGEVYPCDFYIHPDWSLGNIWRQPLTQIAECTARAAFIAQKQPLPDDCARCAWLAVCKGGCPRNRLSLEDQSEAPDYFCASYKQFFAHGDARLRHLRDRVHNHRQYLDQLDVIPLRAVRHLDRNERCPCGSGRKHKTCCGDPTLDRSYIFADQSNRRSG